MKISKNFLEEIKELEKILSECNGAFPEEHRENYEIMLESITEGEDLEEVIKKIKVNENCLMSFDQKAFLIQRIRKGVLKEDYQNFIEKYHNLFEQNKNIKEYKEFLKTAINPEKVLLHVLFLIQEALKGKSYTNLTLLLGERLYKAPSKKESETINEQIEFSVVLFDKAVVKTRLRIADSIMRIGAETLGIYEIRDFRWGRELFFTEKFYKNLEEHYFLNYKEFPMVVEPKDWFHHGSGGGYLKRGLESCVKSKPAISLNFFSTSQEKKPNLAIENINRMQKVRWKVNKSLINLLTKIYEEEDFSLGDELIGKKERERLLSEEHFLSFEEIELIKNSSKELISFEKLNDPSSSVWWRIKNYRLSKSASSFFYLQILKAFSLVDYFYFCHFLDGRGRIYPKGTFTYQSSEIVRACLEFYREEPVDVIENWKTLCDYGTALYGSKVCSENFIRENEINWLEKFNWDFVKKAKKPILFLAFCLEYRKWLALKKEGKTIIYTGFPLYIDAGSNALQHYTAIGGISSLASQLNMTKEMPTIDFYSQISEKIKKKMVSYMETRLSNLETGKEKSNRLLEAELLSYLIRNADLYFNRTLLKTPLMSFGYGVSPYGISEQIIEKLKENPLYQPFLSLNYDPLWLNFLSIPLYSFLEEEMKEITKIQEIFKKWVEKAIKINPKHKIRWSTPAGLKLGLAYVKVKKEEISFRNRANKNRVQSFLVRFPVDELNKTRCKQSFSPNFIHSLDAAHLHLVIRRLFYSGIINLATIHDSLGVSFNFLSEAKKCFKEEFVCLYSDYIDLILYSFLENNNLKENASEEIISLWREQRKTLSWKELLENEKFIKF